MSTNAELNLSTVVDEIGKRLNRLPGTSLVHDIRQLLTNAVDNPTSAKALVAEAVESLGKVSTNTLGHRQIVDDAIGILTATILGEPAEISEQAAKTIETLGSADEKTLFETVLVEALDADKDQKSETCQNCDCEPFACKEARAAIDESIGSTIDVEKKIVACKDCETFDLCKSVNICRSSVPILTEDAEQISDGSGEPLVPTYDEEKTLAEVTETITVTQFAGTKTKVTKKMLTANKALADFVKAGDFVYIDIQGETKNVTAYGHAEEPATILPVGALTIK